MAKYKSEINEYIKERVDLIDLIGSAVELKRAGRTHKGLCPFHSEKTPSFVVNDDKQYYHCFGCGQSGDAITFVMDYENMDYIDALESLAERYSIDLAPMLTDGKTYDINKKELYELMRSAAKYFYSNLSRSQQVQSYLKQRGITPKIARHFGLGYAGDSWNGLMQAMQSLGASKQQLLDCGLIIKNENGRYYDRFRNRLIFPIFDARGRVVAFGGRVLDDSLPKYLNSPETLLFHKSNILYGLNFANKTRGQDTVFLVEGYMDVVAMHQFGFTTAVASLGTALTESQIAILARHYDKLIFAYDSDGAGQKAIMKSLELLAKSDLKVKILKLSQGKDPDEVLKKYGADALRTEISKAQNTIEFRINYFAKEYDLADDAERLKFLRRAYSEMIGLSPSRREFSLNFLAERLELEAALIHADFKDYVDKEKLELTSEVKEAREAVVINKRDKLYRIEVLILRRALSGKMEFMQLKQQLKQLHYEQLDVVYQALMAYYQEHEQIDVVDLSEFIELKSAEAVAKLLEKGDELSDERSLKAALLTQAQLLKEKEIKELEARIQQLRLSAKEESEPKLRAALAELLELKKSALDLAKRLKNL